MSSNDETKFSIGKSMFEMIVLASSVFPRKELESIFYSALDCGDRFREKLVDFIVGVSENKRGH